MMRALCLALCLIAFSLAANERWQDSAYLGDSFVTIALKREYQPGKTARLTRWEQPIRYRLINESGDKAQQQELVAVQMRHLARLTGVAISQVSREDQANLEIVMTRQAEISGWANRLMNQAKDLGAALSDGLCLGYISFRGRLGISRAVVLIPTDRARSRGKFLDCIVEELTQVMGLPNDSDRVYPSIFNDNSVDRFLTPLDYLLLRILYAPELTSNMTEADVRAALPAIIKRLRETGELKHAASRVQAGSMQRWADQ